MIDMQKIDRLLDLVRSKDWAAAHAMLDDDEKADPGEQTVAHWRATVLRYEDRKYEALQYLKDNLHRFNCKTSVFHKRAWIFHEMGNDAAARDEIEMAPFKFRNRRQLGAGDGGEVFQALPYGAGRAADPARTIGGNSRRLYFSFSDGRAGFERTADRNRQTPLDFQMGEGERLTRKYPAKPRLVCLSAPPFRQ